MGIKRFRVLAEDKFLYFVRIKKIIILEKMTYMGF